MIIDTSVLVAILFKESNRARFLEIMATTTDLKISSATLVEAGTVIFSRQGSEGIKELEQLLTVTRCQEVALTEHHRAAAMYGYQHFGKGRSKTPAALNLGDCYSYALAKVTGEPLLFQGDDFSQTDLTWIDLATGQVTHKPTG